MTYTVIIRRGIHGDSGRLAVFHDVVGYGREIVFAAEVTEAANPFRLDIAEIEEIVFPRWGLPECLPAYDNRNSLGVLS